MLVSFVVGAVTARRSFLLPMLFRGIVHRLMEKASPLSTGAIETGKSVLSVRYLNS